MSTPENDANSSETPLVYTPNYHDIFSSRGRNVTNGINSTTTNNKQTDLASAPMPKNSCNQTVQPRSLQHHHSQSQPLQYQPQPQPQQSQPQSQPRPQSEPEQQQQSQPQHRHQTPSPHMQHHSQPHNPALLYHLQQQQPQSQPPRQILLTPSAQRSSLNHINSTLFEPGDSHIQSSQRMSNSESISNLDQAQIPSRSISVPNLEQQPTQQPTRNVSSSYVNTSTSPVMQPPSAHQASTYQRSSELILQSTPGHGQINQTSVNQGCQQKSFPSNQQLSSENQRNQNQQPYTYAPASMLNQQGQSTRVVSNLSPSPQTHIPGNSYTIQHNYYNPQVPRPTVQQVIQSQIPTHSNLPYIPVSANLIIRPQLLPGQSTMIQQSQQNQCSNQCPQVGILLNSPSPIRPNSIQQNINNVTYDHIPYAPSEVINNPYLARALAPTRSSNIDPSTNVSITQNHQHLGPSNTRPSTTIPSVSQVPTSSNSYNPRWRLVQHIDGRNRSYSATRPQLTPTTVGMSTNANQNPTPAPSRKTNPSVKQPSSVVTQIIPTPNILRPAQLAKFQDVSVQTQPDTSNKAMQFDGTHKTVGHKALNAIVSMEDKECQTDDTEDKPVATKLYVDRACSPILSVGLTLLANNNIDKQKETVSVRMKKTTKRKDLNANNNETDSKDAKVRKRESSSDTDVDIETLE